MKLQRSSSGTRLRWWTGTRRRLNWLSSIWLSHLVFDWESSNCCLEGWIQSRLLFLFALKSPKIKRFREIPPNAKCCLSNHLLTHCRSHCWFLQWNTEPKAKRSNLHLLVNPSLGRSHSRLLSCCSKCYVLILKILILRILKL